MFNRIIGRVDNYNIVDLFPYKFKKASNFLFRDHIPFNEDNPRAVAQVQKNWRHIVEGKWINDEGSQVFLPPKLFTYLNIGTLAVEMETGEKPLQFPDFRDNEWIKSSYTLCFDGFSGFADDPDFTCNRWIDAIEKGEDVPPRSLKRLEQHCRRKNGTWKKYIEAWEYLTAFYLMENPREFPLGKALYENYSSNGLTLASRGEGKTAFYAAGDCMHEFITNGARSVEYLTKKIKVALMVATSDKKYLENFMAIAEASWRNVPGAEKGGVSPYFRDATGVWNAERAQIIQGYRPIGSSEVVGSNSEISNAIVQPNKAHVFVSRRLRRAYLEEIGLVPNSKDVLGATKASLVADQGQSGSFVGLGTGGHIEAIKQTKMLALNPKGYDIYPIPNYWKDNSDFCLFIPYTYTQKEYKDEQGNTMLIEATKAAAKRRFKIIENNGDVTTDKQNYPIIPDEMFIAGKSDLFDRDTIIERIGILEGGLWKEKARLYDLRLGRRQEDGTFTVHTEEHFRYNNVLMDVFEEIGSKTGELVVYEEPTFNPEPYAPVDNLYKIVLDPVTEKDTGRSYVAIVVYKGLPKRALVPGEMYYNIVATFKGRRFDEENMMMALLLCMWYKGKLLYEDNVSGVPKFFRNYGLQGLLQATPLEAIKGSTPTTKREEGTGVGMNVQLKADMLKALRKWHTEIVREDENGRGFKQIEDCFDLGLLYEMNFFEDGKNSDLISAMLLLMLWLRQEYNPEYEGKDVSTEDSFRELSEIAADLFYY